MSTTPPAEAFLAAMLAEHRLVTSTQCGAISIPLVHHHADETDRRPGPLRTLFCTEPVGHGDPDTPTPTPHKDTICCWHFQTFEDWQVASRSPRTYDACTCGQMWPGPTSASIQRADAASHGNRRIEARR